MASQLHYLTVQDMLWINLQVTGKVNHFNYAKLEEATYYQYGYGEGKSVVPQAARFLVGFPKMHPFEAGNDATALIACLTFLRINGFGIELTDAKAAAWFESVQARQVDPSDAIKAIAKASTGHHGVPPIRGTVRDLIGQFPSAIGAIVS